MEGVVLPPSNVVGQGRVQPNRPRGQLRLKNAEIINIGVDYAYLRLMQELNLVLDDLNGHTFVPPVVVGLHHDPKAPLAYMGNPTQWSALSIKKTVIKF